MKNNKTILFVCEYGAAKSTIAAAYFNKLAGEQGLRYEAVFRGTNPEPALKPPTVKGLINDGFDITNWKPEICTEKDIQDAFRIVTFDCSVPTVANSQDKVLEWNGVTPISKDYTLGRDEIVNKVKALINTLKNLNK